MIGGFLGAGKSTAIGLLARRLTDAGLHVGLITNDQGSDLVDTASLRAQGFPVEEIAGGCFCCRFNSLRDAATKLTNESRPDVFVAEPVGSCTDLLATVTYPLRRIYGNEFSIAPLSVMVDPIRALRVLGIESGRKFSEKVLYVYRKQLEEAEVVVINKCDLIGESQQTALRDGIRARYPDADVFELSARYGGDALNAWFDAITAAESEGERAPLAIDYDTYADGEALLGWLNCTLELEGAEDFDANALLHDFSVRIQRRLDEVDGEVAHLKMTLSPEGGLNEIALVSLVRQDFVPELGHRLVEPVRRGQLIVNLRAEAAPECLRNIVERELTALGKERSIDFRLDHIESFRPGRPQPTHRVSGAP